MHLIKNKVITLIVALAFSVPAFSQVPSGFFRINEYSCANVSGLTDFSGGTPDWFEIYNTTLAPRSIAGWYVTNDIGKIDKFQFPINTVIPPQGFIVVYASGLDTVVYGPPIEYHAGFDLLQSKPQKIILADNAGIVRDSITIRRHQHNHAWARIPNGSNNWKVFARSTAGVPQWTPGTTNVVTGLKSYKGYLPPPIFSITRGFYTGAQSLSLSIPNSVALIPNLEPFYFGSSGTTGPAAYIGRDPSAFSNNALKNLYDGTPINIDSSTVIRAYLDTSQFTGGGNFLPSFVETHSYIIDQANVLPNNANGEYIATNFTLPVISISYDSTTSGTYPGAGGGVAHNYMVSMEYFGKGSNHPFRFSTIGVTTPGSSDDAPIPGNYVGFDFSAFDEFGYSYTNKQQLYTDNTLGASGRTEQTTISLKAAGSDNFPYTFFNTAPTSQPEISAHLRDPLAQTYAMKNGWELDGLHYQPCIMYINGQYFGIYDIREKFDREYTKYYFGTDSDSIQVLEMDGVLSASPSPNALTNWTSVVNYITTNDMRVDTLRSVADSLLNFRSLMDLIIYNAYTVNTAFPQKAAWWRAHDSISGQIKWRYRMFDMEDTYGLNENDAGLPSTNYDASLCQAQSVYGATTSPDLAHLAIFTSLMESDTFKSQFINRFSYHLNNSLKCPPIISQLNYIRSLLAPEMFQHCTAMLGITVPALDTVWGISVDTMKYWINQRCPTITEDIKTCYNVTGPWSFCTNVEPPGSGTVYLNTVGYPEEHSDNYFGNVWFDAIGSPGENYIFDHWELEGFVLPDSISLENDTLHWLFDSTSCIKAFFKLKEPYLTVGEPSIPTGFSPNGDGYNDLLNVYGTLDVTDYSFQVYSRWGQKIWESGDKTKGWDGMFNGQQAPVGVYAYVFKGTTSDGKLLQKSGNITLIR
ncbi:MAG: hypothetical protein K0S33_3361 [Bacteroidetes bacterium]|jgi:gliding motility-associated-like protein|nr:hypothetical protein [Bacteroidota bacterium]